MRSNVCETCGSFLPEGATFCGLCGSVTRKQFVNTQFASGPNLSFPGGDYAQHEPDLAQYPTQALTQGPPEEREEEEEDTRRKQLLLLAGAVGAIGAGNDPGPSVPMAQGTPQMGAAPSAHGLPQFPQQGHMQNRPLHPGHANQANIPLHPGHANQANIPIHAPDANRINRPADPAKTKRPIGKLRAGVVITTVAVVTIIGAVFIPWLVGAAHPNNAATPTPTLGVTATATLPVAPQPTLASSGNPSPGGTITLHGQHFPAGGNVIFTLDGLTIVPNATGTPTPGTTSTPGGTGFAPHATSPLVATVARATTVTVRNDGTFDSSLTLPKTWKPGSMHTIEATVQNTGSSAVAQLDFAVVPPGATPTPTPGVTPTATPTPIPGVTPTPTPTPTPGVTPTPTPTPVWCLGTSTSSLTFSGVAGTSDPASSQTATLSNCGNAGTWSGSLSTTDGAKWLSANPTSGSLSANGNQGVAVTASNLSVGLAAGTYTGQITFTLGSSTKTVTITLNVTLAPCVQSSSSALTFTTVWGSDPAAQTLTLSNCGPTGSWAGSPTTTSGGNWLSINPTSGSLNSGSRQSIAVTATDHPTSATARCSCLSPGTYTGSITFTLGSASSSVSVTLVVQNPPCISADQSSISLTYYTNYGTRYPTASVVLTDCGDAGTLSSSATTTDGAPWLSSNLSNGTSISAGSTQTVVITAGSTSLTYGTTYTGSITFSITTSAGTRSVVVNVSLYVTTLIG